MNKQKLRANKNTPGTAGGPGGRDRTLAVKRRFFLHISSSCSKILGETNLHTRKFLLAAKAAQVVTRTY